MELVYMNSISFMLKQSLILLTLGMAIVFIFLYIMIIFVNLFHIIIKKRDIETSFETSEKQKETKNQQVNLNELKDNKTLRNNLVAALLTAIKLYESEKE